MKSVFCFYCPYGALTPDNEWTVCAHDGIEVAPWGDNGDGFEGCEEWDFQKERDKDKPYIKDLLEGRVNV